MHLLMRHPATEAPGVKLENSSLALAANGTDVEPAFGVGIHESTCDERIRESMLSHPTLNLTSDFLLAIVELK